jgi:hypothetical protein
MTPYAEKLLAARERKKRPLTATQAARSAHRYQAAGDEKGGLSRQVSAACDRFFRCRGLGEESRSWGFRGK